MLARIHSERNVLWHSIWRMREHIKAHETTWQCDRTLATVTGRRYLDRVLRRLNERLEANIRYERFYIRLTFQA